MFKLKRRSEDEKEMEINMTPMIDCVFQLLIFFMVGTHFHVDDKMLAANLPRNKGLVNKRHINDIKELEHVRITLRYGGPARTVCEVNHQPVPFDMKGDPAGRSLAATLSRIMKAGGGEVPVTIDGEFQVPTGDVVCALNASIAAGFREINFAVPDFLKRGGAGR